MLNVIRFSDISLVSVSGTNNAPSDAVPADEIICATMWEQSKTQRVKPLPESVQTRDTLEFDISV